VGSSLSESGFGGGLGVEEGRRSGGGELVGVGGKGGGNLLELGEGC